MPSQFTYKPDDFSSQNKPENTAIFQPLSTGKEKDSETGYYYFGARYYNPDLSLWLSVDPMADKYPSLSPYNYCAWNPVKFVDPDGEQVRPTPRYATANRPQRYVHSHSQRTVYRSSNHTVTSYSRTGRSNISHAPTPTLLKQQKLNGIVSQYNERYGEMWVGQVAKLIDNEMEHISTIVKNKEYSIVKTETRTYTDIEYTASTSSYIQFDDPTVQEKFDEAQATWAAASNKIQEEHTIALPNGGSSLDYEGLEAMTKLGKSPMSRVMDQTRKNRAKFKVTEQTTRPITSIQRSDN